MRRIYLSLLLLLTARVAAQSTLWRPSDFEPRPAAAVAFEPNTGSAFLFGGGSNTTIWRNDLWRFVEGQWLPVQTNTHPPATPDPVACTWPGHGMLLVVGTGTWLFDGFDWQQLLLPQQPAAVRTMTHDDLRGIVVAIAPGATTATSRVWEFDGSDWTERTPAPTPAMPPTLALMRLAYDAVQQVCLLRINNLGSSATGHYTWNGTAWSQLGIGGSAYTGWAMATAPAPGSVLITGGIDTANLTSLPTALYAGGPIPDAPARRRHAVAWYDSIADVTVVTATDGGNLGSWAWDGTAWTQPPLGQHVPVGTRQFTFDSWTGRLLAFSGHHWLQADHHDQLWQLRDALPTMLAPGTGTPPARIRHGVAFDSWRGRLVVFGGTRFDSFGGHYYPWTGDGGAVHEWDGQDWHTLPSGPFAPAADPRFRMDPALSFDRARGRVVMFGGGKLITSFTPIYQNDTYEWDGATWTVMQPSTSPPAVQATMHFDVDRRQCVLLAAGTPWAWDGSDWAQLPLPTPPTGRMHYDAARGTYVVARLAETWELHGSTWTLVPGVELPNVVHDGAIAFDPSLGRFAGSDGRGAFVYGDANAAWIRPFGDGCGGSAGTPRLIGEDPPRLDRTVHLRLVTAPLGAAWFAMFGSDTGVHAGLPLPLDLAPLGMPGCTLLTAIDVHQLRFAPDWPIHVPAQVLLLGQQFTTQAFVLDAAANALGAVTSTALRLHVGGF